MRLRTFLAATAASALFLGGVGIPAHSVTVPPDAAKYAGTITTWGDEANINGGPAINIPDDLTSPVRSVSASQNATGVVTVDGKVRVWGQSGAAEVTGLPAGITDATAIALGNGHGAVLRTDGHVTAWGNSVAISEVPDDLRAKAVTTQLGTGYAVRTDGTLATWGDAPATPVPDGLTDLVDVAASLSHVLALRADGTVVTWGAPLPGLLTVPDFGGKKVVKLAVSLGYSGVVFEDGTIDIWGFAGLIPAGEPAFDGLTPAGKVVSLGLWANGAAVTADGAVHVWGPTTDVSTVPTSLSGKPVSAIAMGQTHAAVIVTAFRALTKPTIAGTAALGETLTATPATFSLEPDAPATGQWYAAGEEIDGETGTTLAFDDDSLKGKTITYHTLAKRGSETLNVSSKGTSTVKRALANVNLSVSPATAAAGTARTVTATVTKTGGTPTGTITFKVGGSTGTDILSNGVGTWTLPVLGAGTHHVTAVYSGDSVTGSSTATPADVVVTQTTSTVTAKAKGSKKSKKATITITVTTATGISPAGTATVTLRGKTKKTVAVYVNSAGKATVTIKKVKRGKYTVGLNYGGNGNVTGSAGTAKFKF